MRAALAVTSAPSWPAPVGLDEGPVLPNEVGSDLGGNDHLQANQGDRVPSVNVGARYRAL